MVFAPPLQPDTFQPIQTLLVGQIPTSSPVIVSLFSLIGIWLLIYSCLVFDAKSTGIILLFSTLVLLIYALVFGDWSAFVQEFLTNRFIHGRSLAFCLLCLLFPYPTLLSDDMARHGLTSNSQLFWFVAWIPLFGTLVHLCLRPQLLSLRNTN